MEKNQRVESLDLLRGVVMIIMALDHVRDYFHEDAFFYSPTDLGHTSAPIFFTRWITHYCAPVFVFLAGISACLYGNRRGRPALVRFLWTRGLWLLFVEFALIGPFRTFGFSFVNLQVIWVIGASMLVLSLLVLLHRRVLLVIGVALVAGHNLLDGVHLPLLHDASSYLFGGLTVMVRYPLLPWLGIMVLGYYAGSYYLPSFDAAQRKAELILMGFVAIGMFILLRFLNWYGDPSHWAVQKDGVFSVLSFLNVTKYPPSLLYILMTLGPALIFLAVGEQPLGPWGRRIALFGRTAMFYYLAHVLLIHIWAVVAAVCSGYSFSDMVLSGPVNDKASLKGFGFSLFGTYVVWAALVVVLYPLCKWYDRYKRANQVRYWWLSYL